MRRVLWLGGSITVLALFSSLQAQQQLPRVQASDLVYEGAFRVPTSGNSVSSFEGNAGGALTYNPANNSLFAVGHINVGAFAEITIPTPSTATSLNSLPIATYRQQFTDILEGRRCRVSDDPNGCPIGGALVYGNSLIITAYNAYDGDGSQTLSHFKVNRDFSVTGDVQGPYALGSAGAGRVAGYMAPMPSEWQSLFNTTAFTGLCCISIQSRTNSGPGVSSFNAADVGVRNPIPGTELLGYPLEHKPEETIFKSGGADMMGGVVVPAGTRSILFFGRHGEGPLCYGTPAECGDPVNQDKGYHAYPYVPKVWAYDLNDLLAVKNGTKQEWELRPYAMWTLPTRFGSEHGILRGATYDPTTKRVFVAAYSDAEGYSRPVIHVYRLSVGTGGGSSSAPQAPSNLRIVG